MGRKNKRKGPKKDGIQTDEKGHFIWETHFLRGKQKRRKVRVTVIDGEIIEDLDTWLLANADDIALHQMERWDLMMRRQRVVEWLEVHETEPQWDCDLFQPPQRPEKRPELLRAVLQFVRDVRRIDGVRRIALLGSLTTDKAIPKDVDALVEVTDEAPLDGLARRKRQLLGKAMQSGDGCGADVFLCNPKGEYLGRVCSWKQCAPGVRQACQAQHCGRRHFLCDDLQNVTLGRSLLAAPPLDLWPDVQARVELPADVRTELVEPLEAELHEPS